MTLRSFVLLSAVALPACAGAKGGSAALADRFYAMPLVPAASAPAPMPDFDPASMVDAFQLEISFERADGSRFLAPRITCLGGQTCSVSVGEDVSYVADFEVEVGQDSFVADPVVKTVHDGVRFEACVQRVADGGVCLGYRVNLSNLKRPIEDFQTTLGAYTKPVTVQIPVVETAAAEGARWIEPGVQGLLARISSPDGSGPMLVLARVTTLRVEAPAPGAEHPSDAKLSRPMSGHTLHLRISAAEIGRDVEPGTVIDETAAPDVLKAAGGAVLRDFESFTCLDSRVRLAGLLESAGKSQGFVAEGRDDGRIDLSWTTASGTRRATMRPNAGRRFVALARIEGGGTAGAIVSLDAD